jgi:hypothetical protein
MRYVLPAALVAILFSVQAAAQGKKDKKKGKDDSPAGSMAETGPDPVDEETSDDGRFAPKGKTGKLKESKKKKTTEQKIEEIPRKKINLWADLLAVWGTPPEPDAQPIYDPDESVTAYGFILGGTYDLQKDLSLGLRLPFSRADLDATRMAGIELEGTSNALGNPEIIGQYRIKMSPGVYIPIDAGLGIPLAQGDPDPTSADPPGAAKAMVNRTMDAGTAWHDSELYYVGRVPLKLGVGYLRQRVKWNVHASTKIVAAPKIRGELEVDGILPVDIAQDVESYEYNSVALRNMTYVGISGNAVAGLWLGIEGWVGINIIDEIVRNSEATPPSAFQLALEPALGYDFDFLKVSLSWIKPIGGRNEDIQGARLRAEMGF